MGQTEGSQEADALRLLQSNQQQKLFDLGSPGQKLVLSDLFKDLGKPGSVPESVKKAFEEATTSMNKEFESEKAASPLTLAQRQKESGDRGGSRALSSQSDQVLYNLERMRRGNLREFKQKETDAAMSQRDFDLSQILGIGMGNVGQAFSGQSNLLSLASMGGKNPWGSAASGAFSGAMMGASTGNPYVAAGGAIVGGLGGYFS